MTDAPKFTVGQRVWRHEVNRDRRGGPQRVTVTKVARKYVTVGEGHRAEKYELATGQKAGNYRHSWLCTETEHAEHIAWTEALRRIERYGLRFESGRGNRIASATLNAIADVLDSGGDQ